MNDVIDTGEATFGFRSKQAVRVRNDSNPEEHRIPDRASSPCPRYPKTADFGLLFKIDRSKQASGAAGIHLDGYGFNKKARHMPLRQPFGRIPNVVTQLAPCVAP